MTGWALVPANGAGVARPGGNDPDPVFRVARLGPTILVDLAGVPLNDSEPGMAMIGTLPSWATSAIADRYFWVNDSATGLHPSVCAIHQGAALYWCHQIIKGQVAVNRPAALHGGFEYTTLSPTKGTS